MATPTVAEIKARYPALASIPDPTVQIAIDDAACMFNEARWGCLYAQGLAAYVAHQLTVEQRAAAGGSAAAAGPMTAKRVGEVQYSYAAGQFTKATDAFYATTAYGQKYLQLRRLAGIGAAAV